MAVDVTEAEVIADASNSGSTTFAFSDSLTYVTATADKNGLAADVGTPISYAQIIALSGTNDSTWATGGSVTQFYNVDVDGGNDDSAIILDNVDLGTWGSSIVLLGVTADVIGDINAI